MGNGRQGVLQTWCTAANGDEKAQKHPHRRHHRFGPTDPFIPSPMEHESPQSLGLIAFGLLTEGLEQSDDRQTVAVQGGFGRASVRAHPVTKGAKEFGDRRRGNHRGSWRHEPGCLKEAHKVARSDKEMAIAAAGIAKALGVVEMMTKRLECFCIEFLKR